MWRVLDVFGAGCRRAGRMRRGGRKGKSAAAPSLPFAPTAPFQCNDELTNLKETQHEQKFKGDR